MPGLIVHDGGMQRVIAEIARQAVDDLMVCRKRGIVVGSHVACHKWPKYRGHWKTMSGMYGPKDAVTACGFFKDGHFECLSQVVGLRVSCPAALSRLGFTEAR